MYCKIKCTSAHLRLNIVWHINTLPVHKMRNLLVHIALTLVSQHWPLTPQTLPTKLRRRSKDEEGGGEAASPSLQPGRSGLPLEPLRIRHTSLAAKERERGDQVSSREGGGESPGVGTAPHQAIQVCSTTKKMEGNSNILNYQERGRGNHVLYTTKNRKGI